MSRVLLLLSTLLIPFSVFCQHDTQKLSNYISTIKNDNKLKGSLFSIKVTDCASGKTIFSQNSDLRMVPASIQKTITTGVALEKLGNNYTYTTSIYYDGEIKDSVLTGNIYIEGGGDPSLGSPNFTGTVTDSIFNKISNALVNKGICTIKGEIIVKSDYYNCHYSTEEYIHPTWEWEDIGSYYGTALRGFNFHENYFTTHITCNSATNINTYADMPYPMSPDILYDLSIIHKDSVAELLAVSSPLSSPYIIRGKIPANGKETKIDAALQHPGDAFIFWLRSYLMSKGINVDNQIQQEKPEKHLLAEIKSPPLSEIAMHTNYTSSNLYADALFKGMAKEKNGKCTFDESAKTMEEYLKAMGLKTSGIRLVDGSGLSRHNYITADFMCEYLRKIKQTNKNFHHSLPYPGADKSTLKYFMSGYKNKRSNSIFLKSGSMTGVVNYAGYITGKNGEVMCVTIMTNNFLCKTREMRPVLERVVYLISEM